MKKTRTPGDPIEHRLRMLLSRELGTPPSRITRESALVYDLGTNSLEFVEFAMAAEVAFDIELEAEDLPRLLTFGQFVDHVAVTIERQHHVHRSAVQTLIAGHR